MGELFVSIKDTQALDELLARSHEAPVLLFKHSNACPISSAAYRQMTRVDGEVAIVVVQHSRDISNEVAERMGVRHESPQALVIRNGAAVWTATHYGITADAVARALQENAG